MPLLIWHLTLRKGGKKRFTLLIMVVVIASTRQALMELQTESPFAPLINIFYFLVVSISIDSFYSDLRDLPVVVIFAVVVPDGQSFPCKTVHVYFLTETGQEKKDMSRSNAYNSALHPASWDHNNNGSLVRLYCVDEHRNGPP